MLPAFKHEITRSEKLHRFFYSITVADEEKSNSTSELFSKHLNKYIENFDSEYKRKHKNFAMLSKFKVSLIKLKRLSKESEEQAVLVNSLLKDAPKEEKEDKKKKLKYIPVKHAHHYDDIISKYVTRVYHQPQPEDTKSRLRELMVGEFKFITEKDDEKESVSQSITEAEPSVLKRHDSIAALQLESSTGRTINSVSYAKNDDKAKEKKNKTLGLSGLAETNTSGNNEGLRGKSLLEQWQQEVYTEKKSIRRAKDEQKLLQYAPVSFKARAEVERAAPDERMRKSYIKRSKKWELIGNADDYESDDEDEAERQYRIRQNMNATYAL
jgi:hypothetical protein